MVILFMQYLIIFLISMVPLIELRGAIPYAIGFKLPLLPSYIICILGNMLPVPFIFLFARKILVWGSDKKYIGGFFNWCLKKGEKGGKKLQEKAGRGLYVALFLFVGIPLPAHGQEHLQQAFLIWILKRAHLLLCVVSCWQASSWD